MRVLQAPVVVTNAARLAAQLLADLERTCRNSEFPAARVLALRSAPELDELRRVGASYGGRLLNACSLEQRLRRVIRLTGLTEGELSFADLPSAAHCQACGHPCCTRARLAHLYDSTASSSPTTRRRGKAACRRERQRPQSTVVSSGRVARTACGAACSCELDELQSRPMKSTRCSENGGVLTVNAPVLADPDSPTRQARKAVSRPAGGRPLAAGDRSGTAGAAGSGLDPLETPRTAQINNIAASEEQGRRAEGRESGPSEESFLQFPASQRSAFALLQEFLQDYDQYDVLEAARSAGEGKPKVGSRDVNAHPEWPLDIPDVSLVRLKELRDVAEKEARESLKLAIDLIQHPPTFEKRVLEPKFKVQSAADVFLPDLPLLTSRKFIRAIPRAQVRGFVTGFTVLKRKKKKRRTVINAIPTNDRMEPPPGVKLPSEEDVDEAVRRLRDGFSAATPRTDRSILHSSYRPGPVCVAATANGVDVFGVHSAASRRVLGRRCRRRWASACVHRQHLLLRFLGRRCGKDARAL